MTSQPDAHSTPDLSNVSDVQGSLEALYNAVVVDHIAHPRNLGVLEDATGTGLVDDAETENLIIFYVRVEAERVVAASFRAIACSACIAASSMTTGLLIGRRSTGDPVTADQVLDALGGLPESKHHCAELAARAANLAVAYP